MRLENNPNVCESPNDQDKLSFVDFEE